MKFVVPEKIGNELRVVPADTYNVVCKELIFGESDTSKQPKVTFKHVIMSEYSGPKDPDFQTTVGADLLDSGSLQPHALFRVNDYFKVATGHSIPAKQDGYEKEEFEQMLKDAIQGASFKLLVEVDTSQGDERNKVKKVTSSKTTGGTQPAAGPTASSTAGKKLKR